MRNIKFIWDFRGEFGEETAKHHARHLNDFFKNLSVDFEEVGCFVVSEYHTLAFVIAAEDKVDLIKAKLKPHRAEIAT